MKKLILASSLSVVLAACGGGGGGGSSDSSTQPETNTSTTPVDTNVALKTNSASATASYNADSAENIIDGDEATTWISDPDSPLVIELAEIEKINKLEVSMVPSGGLIIGSNPDITIEFSTDGETYSHSQATYAFSGVPCSSSTTSSSSISCEMPEYEVKFIRLTTKNGKSLEFKELNANAMK